MSMHIPTSTKEVYTLRRKLLVAQYDLIVTPYKKFHDDRRIAYNSYHMMLKVCDEMIAADTIITSASIRVSVRCVMRSTVSSNASIMLFQTNTTAGFLRRIDMTPITTIFTLIGVLTLTHYLMKLITYLDTPRSKHRRTTNDLSL